MEEVNKNTELNDTDKKLHISDVMNSKSELQNQNNLTKDSLIKLQTKYISDADYVNNLINPLKHLFVYRECKILPVILLIVLDQRSPFLIHGNFLLKY